MCANGGQCCGCSQSQVCYRVAFQFEGGYRGGISSAVCGDYCNWGYHSPSYHSPNTAQHPESATALNIFRVDPKNHNFGCVIKTLIIKEIYYSKHEEKWCEGYETQMFKASCPNPVLING